MGKLIKVRKNKWKNKSKKPHILYEATDTSEGLTIIKRNMKLFELRQKRVQEDRRELNSEVL
jgi:hypothetical protein